MHFNMSFRKFKEYVQNGLIGFKEEKEKPDQNDRKVYSSHINEPSDIAIIVKSELDYISRCILDYKNIETGGQLFGYWSANGTPIVLYAIGPGKNANHQVTFFNQDIDYLVEIGTILNQKYGLHHIGEWHSHHQLGLAQPSGHDASTMVTSIRNKHLGRFLLCIGNCTNTSSTLNAYNFTENSGRHYIKAKWLVKQHEGLSFRSIIDRDLTGLIIHPCTQEACHGNLYLANANMPSSENKKSPFAEGYWLTDKTNGTAFAEIRSYLERYTGRTAEIKLVESDKTLSLKLQTRQGMYVVHFPMNFPVVAPDIYLIDDWDYKRELQGDWIYNGNIVESFKNYFSTL